MPDTYKPTEAMASAARRAKKMRDSQPPSNQGMTRTGLERMNQLINREPLSLETVKRMYSFFSRHEVDKQSDSWKKGDSKAEQAWLGWGGDAGFAWAKRIVEQSDKQRESNMNTEGNQRAQFIRAINKSQIERRTDGWTIRDVVPVVDDIVMNGGLYPAEELNRSYNSLDGVPAPIGHPRDSKGNFISAMRGEGLRNYYAGVTVENARKQGDKVLVDLEINEEQMKSHPRYDEIVAELNSGESMHVSTGLLLQRNQEAGTSKGKKYTWRAENMEFDHLALLPSWEGPGAATPEDGVGIMANGVDLVVNLDEYESSCNEQEQRIADKVLDKLRSLFQPGYNANHAQSMPTSENSGDTEMDQAQVEALVAEKVAGLATNADMDALKEENMKLKEELNMLKKKMSANEDAQLEQLANEAAELTGDKAEDLKSMGANALQKIIDVAKANRPAFSANASRAAGSQEETYEMAD